MSKVKIEGVSDLIKPKIENAVLELVKGRLTTIKGDLTQIDKDLTSFSKKYLMTEDEFLKKFDDGSMGDDEDFFVWNGSIKIRLSLLEERDLLREIL